MTKNLLRKVAGCVLVASLAAGCGSSHNGNDAAPAQPEDVAASSSVAGLIGFAQAQIARTDEVSEPRAIAGISPPVSDVDDPAAI